MKFTPFLTFAVIAVLATACSPSTSDKASNDTTATTTDNKPAEIASSIDEGAPSVDEGIILKLSFDLTVDDFSDHGNTSTETGNIVFDLNKEGMTQGAASFDGESYLMLSDGSNDQLLHAPFTIATWFKTDDVGAKDMWLVTRATNTDKSGIRFGYTTSESGSPIYSFTINGSSEVNVTAPSTLKKDEWVFVTASIDDAGSVKIYENGKQVSAMTIQKDQFDLAKSNLASSVEPIEVAHDLVSKNFFKGTVDDIAIWNRALSSKEVESLMK